jgi:hypothetical protein
MPAAAPAHDRHLLAVVVDRDLLEDDALALK